MVDLPRSHETLRPLPPGAIQLLDRGGDHARRELTRDYLLSLEPRKLLQNHLMEAGRLEVHQSPFDLHGGWEAPSSQVRGHVLGHWLAAAATLWATTGDTRLKGAIDHVVAELATCQEHNGGEWVASIPEKYLHWIRRGRPVWAPTYVVHKTLMGLFEAFRLAGNEQALDVVVNAARWFSTFTDGMSRDELDDLLDWETGGIQELWADLYDVTGDDDHRELIERFDRRRLFDRLLEGQDPLTNQHANQQVAEILAAARAYEVTGQVRWREVVEAFWRSAVTDRGWFATGGQTFGEYWTPPFELGARLGATNQEHCVVYNMSRLAERLLCWTGEARYADYLERNRINGLYAQQHPRTGMAAYYLPLHAGARKRWADPTETFWCCVGTQMQAGARIGSHACLQDDDGLIVADYVPATIDVVHQGVPVNVRMRLGPEAPAPGHADPARVGSHRRPHRLEVDLEVDAAQEVDAALRLRLPWWLAGEPVVTVDGSTVDVPHAPGTFATVRRRWSANRVHVELPTALTADPLPDQPDTVAFMDGPRVLAGLVDERRTLYGDVADPRSLLEPDGEFEFGRWHARWSTRGQPRDFRLVPIEEIGDEPYTVYFPVRPTSSAPETPAPGSRAGVAS